MPFSEKVVSFLKVCIRSHSFFTIYYQIVAPALNIPLAHEVDYVEARLDQRLRILLVQFPSIASPVVFSSKFCNYDALDESVGHRDHQWSVPNRPSNTSQRHEDGVYSGRVLTPIGSKIVIMKISTDEVGSKSVCFGVRQPGILKCIPLRVEREILMFDSTFPEYVEIMNSLFIKKWSNHLLIYDAYYRSMRWKIGWNDYSFVLGKGASESRERKLVGNILPATGTWYCAKHDKFSLIRLRIEDHHNLLQFMYKLSYSFPWSTRSVRLEALRSGAAFWIDHTNPAISELLSGISAKETVDFVHLVLSPNKRRLYLTVAESPTLVFMNC
jgi:hypothetical protein